MDQQRIKDVFSAFFDKFKKTEGDRTSWSAFWSESNKVGTLEITMTDCPAGLSFKFFVNRRKMGEFKEWAGLFEGLEKVEQQHPGLYEADVFFGNMAEMV